MIAYSCCLRESKLRKVLINKALNWKNPGISIIILLLLCGCVHHAKPVAIPKVDQPIHIALTSEIIDTLNDVDLVSDVFQNLIVKLPDDYTKEYGQVTGWSKPEQAVYITHIFSDEVDNGGFNQYYVNSSKQYAELATWAFQEMGGDKYASLALRANLEYAKEKARITKFQDGSSEGFSKSYENNPLNAFDDEFYKLDTADNLIKLQAAFIRKNKNSFADH
jgi:hypothetical protein